MLRSGGRLGKYRAYKKARTASGVARRAVARRIPRPIMSEKVPYFFKLRVRLTGYLTSGVAGTMSQFIYTNDPSGCSDWSPLSSLFDQFQVKKVKLTFVPKYVDASPFGAVGTFGLLCVRYDADSGLAPTTVDEAIQYDNNMYLRLNTIQRYAITNVTQTDNSVSNAGMAIAYKPGYGNVLDVANVANYHKGNIGWFGDGFTVSTNYSDLVVEYHVLFFGRR